MSDEMNQVELDEARLEQVIDALVAKHGEGARQRAETGVRQAASRWRPADGSFEAFEALTLEHFVSDPAQIDALFGRFEDGLEQIRGHVHEIRRFLKRPTDLDIGPALPVDGLFARYNLASHVTEDLFQTGVGFAVLLNFEQHTLSEKLAAGDGWSRLEWAHARAADVFSSRVPPEVRQEITAAYTAADDYIANYNIHMHRLIDAEGERLFPEGLKLITHWGLRDELKARYASADALPAQRMIAAVMRKIVTQDIPAVVVDNPDVDWTVSSGEVSKGEATREPDTRYLHLGNTFRAVKLADPFFPGVPTYVQRKFEIDREIPEEEVVKLLTSVVSAPVIKEVGELVARRLGRDLEPFDIWYDGFSARGSRSEAELDEIVRGKYPTVDAFQKDIVNILEKLGFEGETARFISTKIVVDPSRGAGHAWGAERREDSAHLRTRVGAKGMDYKGYNIAVHELGHNVEQVLSLNRIDHYLLSGTPNTAFTEGFAFTFQGRDMALLGLEGEDPDKEHLRVLDTIWNTFEISGVALVDIRIWKWMYAHPEFTPAELREAVLEIARGVWNEYFAPVFGVRDEILLAVYSHIIDAGMYTPDYPIGFLIQFQMEDYFAKKGLADEMVRMCTLGSITPDAWMREAVGAPISAEPMIKAAEKSLAALK